MLNDAIVFLAAAVLCVPLLQRLGFGSILGYLFAGIVIGPWGLGLIEGVEQVLDFAELGIVLLLFMIGLELTPKRLRLFRRTILTLGGGQVLLCLVALALLAFTAGQPVETALIVGFGLALSSTAFAIQMLSEQGLLNTQTGRKAFAILLFQDLAVVPLLALLPVLGGGHPETAVDWTSLAIALALSVGLVIVGRPLVNTLFRFVVLSRSAEIFTAATLLFVFGLAAILHELGLSMALGAFTAGIVLAESGFRHQIEAEIQPFRGLLMGLFFMAVGMSIDIGLLMRLPLTTLGIVIALMAVKAVLIALVVYLHTRSPSDAFPIAGALAQGGEFAFVLFGLARDAELIDPRTSDLLILVVTLSMVLTPLCFAACRWLAERKGPSPDLAPPPEDMQASPVLIAGFGRMGQIVGKVLSMLDIPYTAIDEHPEQIQLAAQKGQRIVYGNPCNPELLRAVGAEHAKIIVITLADPEESIRAIEQIMSHFPHLRIIARARNRQHSRQLIAYDIAFFTRETFESSVLMGEKALELLGFDDPIRRQAVQEFRVRDAEQLLSPIRQLTREDMEVPD